MQYMKLEPFNPVVKKEVSNTIINSLGGVFTCPDYDDTRYCIELNFENNRLYFSFKIPNFNDIYKISGDYMMKKLYKEYQLESVPAAGFDMTISISLGIIKEIPKIQNPTPEDEENKKKIKEENKRNIENISIELSKFRVNFLSCPFQYAFDQVREGKQTKFTYSTRQGDRVWCLGDAEQITLFFGLSFQDTVDKNIAKLMLDEFVDIKKHIKNPPSITRTMEDQKFVYPQNLIDAFPELKNIKEVFLNGLMQFTFFKKQHLNGDTDEVCNFLGTFRQYLHYHISASKSYLHIRLLKNINTNLTNLQRTKFEQEEERSYRSQRDELITNKVQEETKKNILIKQ
ncbi:hypothetical protein ABPG72_016706 [Tetrahymena utriculariae]